LHISGERLTDEEVSDLIAGQEDAHGNINYEGNLRVWLMIDVLIGKRYPQTQCEIC